MVPGLRWERSAIGWVSLQCDGKGNCRSRHQLRRGRYRYIGRAAVAGMGAAARPSELKVMMVGWESGADRELKFKRNGIRDICKGLSFAHYRHPGEQVPLAPMTSRGCIRRDSRSRCFPRAESTARDADWSLKTPWPREEALQPTTCMAQG
jgi:hypothetical protein